MMNTLAMTFSYHGPVESSLPWRNLQIQIQTKKISNWELVGRTRPIKSMLIIDQLATSTAQFLSLQAFDSLFQLLTMMAGCSLVSTLVTSLAVLTWSSFIIGAGQVRKVAENFNFDPYNKLSERWIIRRHVRFQKRWSPENDEKKLYRLHDGLGQCNFKRKGWLGAYQIKN